MKLFKAIFTLSALLVITGLQARQMYIGNLNFEDKFRQSGVVKGDTVGASVFVSSEDLSDKIGAELKRVSFYYNSTTAPKYLKLFVSSSLDSINIFSKDIETSTIIKGWNELELDSAYVISGDSLYLGYYLLGASTSSAVANNSSVQSFIKKGSTEDWVSTKGIAVYGTIYGDSLPAHDIVLTSDLNDIDVEVAKSFNVAFAVENVAADTIKTIEIECDYGDGKKENKIIDTNIPYLSSDSIVYEGIVLDTTGLFNLTFTVLKLNGEDDLTPENNTHTIKVNVIERIVKRKLLFEVFSTENCTACPKGHDIIEASIDGRHDDIIEVGHHVGFYTDQWTVPADTIYMNFYYAAIVTTFAPAGVIDRTLFSKANGHSNPYQGGDSCVVFSVESADVWNLFNVALEKPAYAWIDLDVQYDEIDSMLVIKTAGKSVTTLSGEPRLTIYVTEDNLASDRQAGWNSAQKGPYYQHNVNRYIATDVWGDQIALNEGFDSVYKVKVQPNWNVDNLNVVAFVHNYSTKSNVKERYTDFNVYNAEKVQVRPHEVAVDDVTKGSVFAFVYQDVLEVVGEYKSGVIYNVNGQAVSTLSGNTTMSIANMPNGVYVVSLTLADGTNYNTKIVK